MESEEELNLLMRVKEKSEKVCWNLNIQNKKEYHGIQSHHFKENRRRKSGNSDIFYFLGLQNHWGQWLQPWNSETFALWKENFGKHRQHTKKQRHHFLSKVCIVKAIVFPVAMYGCKCWTIEKIECWRTDAFELWCWRRLLRVPWTARW